MMNRHEHAEQHAVEQHQKMVGTAARMPVARAGSRLSNCAETGTTRRGICDRHLLAAPAEHRQQLFAVRAGLADVTDQPQRMCQQRIGATKNPRTRRRATGRTIDDIAVLAMARNPAARSRRSVNSPPWAKR
jgi:hypothetical protein